MAKRQGSTEAGKKQVKIDMKVAEDCIPLKIKEYQQKLIKNITPAEERFYKVLRIVSKKIGFDFEFQSVYQNPETGKYYIVDFAIPFYRMVIEIDGHSHKVDEQMAMDEVRDKSFADNKYKILRVKNAATKYQTTTIKIICKAIQKTAHAMKAYSILKKIQKLDREKKYLIEDFQKRIDKAYDVSVLNIFSN